MFDEEDQFPNPFDDPVTPEVTPHVTPHVTPQVTPQVEPVLTDEMKEFLDENWKDMDLMEMTRHIFKNENLKGSSREGRIVREYLITKGYQYKTSERTKREVVLTDEMKQMCIQYADSMKPYEIARVIFEDEKLHPASKEALLVQTYIKNVNPALIKKDDEYTDADYVPPKTIKAVIKRIGEVTGLRLDEEKMNHKTSKAVERCIDFLMTPRFILTCTNLKNVSERQIFESEYIRSVWDKPDLTTDEINLYISLMNEYVIQDRLHRIMGKLNMTLENVTEDKDGEVSIRLSTALKGKSEELHQSLSRQQKFAGDLQGKRSERQAKQIARQKSLVSLVEAFRDEQERKNAVRIANIRRTKVETEMNRLETEDEWDARIFGITKEEIME